MKLLLSILFFTFCMQSFGQTSPGNDPTKYLWSKYQYGERMARYQADSVMGIPRDTTYSKSGIATKGNRLYIGNGTRWYDAGSATSSSISSVYAGSCLTKVNDSTLALDTSCAATKYYVDSLFTQFNINNGIDSNSRVITGSAIIDSNFDGHTTSWYYKINGVYYTSAATPFFQITASNPSADRYTVAYLDTLGNFGLLDGPYSTNPVQIPTVDFGSQLAVALYYIPAGSTTPYLVSNEDVYKDATEWTLLRRNTTSGFDSAYTVNPYAGLYSILLPQHINGQYWEATDGTDHLISDFSFLSFHLRLASAFPTNSVWGITLWYDSSIVSSNEVRVNTGTYGYNRTVSGSYQGISVPVGAWNMYSGTFNKIRFTQKGNSAIAQQIDNIVLQTGGANVNNNNFVVTVNGVSGPNVVIPIGDSIAYNADTSLLRLINKRTGAVLASVPSLLSYFQSSDTCIVIDTTNMYLTKTAYISFNTNCAGSGGGGSGITTLGTPAYGLTKLNDSTYIVDTTVIASKTYAAALAALKADKTTTLTINGVAQDLSANRTWSVGTVTQSQLNDTAAAIRADFPTGGGSSGISTLGSPTYGLTKVNDSTYRADSTVLASKAYADALAALKLNISDTAAMLLPYRNKINQNTDSITAHNLRIIKNSDSLFAHNIRIGQNKTNIDTAYVAMGLASDSSYVLFYHSNRTITPDTLRAFGVVTMDTTWQTLTDGATVTFNTSNGRSARVTLGGNRTLAFTNFSNGMFLSLLVIQDGTGSRTLTLPASTKVIAGGAGAVTLTTTASAHDILTFWKINNILYCNYGKNYN